ncbi:hypothetical protein VP01_2630g2 [Puccinia sorghi]|uniref:RRM domain-containing protein n=1 Tax=Puccinia sorghi TaxID=27349 RepID=A0A0L6V4C4_9BASI|nr:hypothetical protein VP01_2630g2 [Puccinia sorghi]
MKSPIVHYGLPTLRVEGVPETQQFQSDGFGTRIKVNNVPKSGEHPIKWLNNYFACSGIEFASREVTEVQQLKHDSPGEHQQFMISFQQAETARCVLTSMDGLSLGGCKMYVLCDPVTSVAHKMLNKPLICLSTPPSQSFNWRLLGGRTQRHENGKNTIARPVIRCDARVNGGYSPHQQMASNLPQEKPREASKTTDLGAASFRKNCNLYVLNLSLDMTNESLKAIIQGSGEVKHVCVLATLDNAGRRRAFVDMATPEEACCVVENFHGKRIEGYELHISYAFIQRSGGPTVPVDGNSTAKGARPAHHDPGARPPTSRKPEEREKYFTAKKATPHSPAWRSAAYKAPKVSTIDTNNLLHFNHAPSQLVSRLDSVGRSPESDMESFFSFTPSSSYDSGADSPESSTSVLFETSIPEQMNFGAPLASEQAYPPWTLLVSNLSPVACIDDDDLFRFFIRQGVRKLKSAFLNVNSQSGMSLGHGTITFDCINEYQRAFEMINSRDISLGGSRIKCSKLSHYTPTTSSSYSSASSPLTSEASGSMLPASFNPLIYPASNI